MSIRSNSSWSIARSDRHLHHEPETIGRRGRQAGVWKAFTLAGQCIGYLVGKGKNSLCPIAFVFGSGPDFRTTPADYRTARVIAADHRRAGEESHLLFDLRNCRMNDRAGIPSWLFSIVLRPADRKGRAVLDSTFEGTMFSFQPRSKWCRGGLCARTAIRGSGGIPWENKNGGLIPTFEMEIDEGWNSAQVGLADFIDRTNKNSGVLPASLAPGQSETNKAAIAAA